MGGRPVTRQGDQVGAILGRQKASANHPPNTNPKIAKWQANVRILSESGYNREINREFRQIDPLCAISKADTQVNSKTCSKIPYATEQGINSAEQGIPAQQQGILSAKSEIIIIG